MNSVPQKPDKKRSICPCCGQEIKEFKPEINNIEKQLSLKLRNQKIDRLFLYCSLTLNKWELNFLDNIRQIENLSERQTKWLDVIWNKKAPYIPQPEPYDNDDFL